MGFLAQYNPVSTMLEQIDDAINTINELNVWAKWGIGAFLTLVALGIMRLILKKVTSCKATGVYIEPQIHATPTVVHSSGSRTINWVVMIFIVLVKRVVKL